jgi:hypothetical protein
VVAGPLGLPLVAQGAAVQARQTGRLEHQGRAMLAAMAIFQIQKSAAAAVAALARQA